MSSTNGLDFHGEHDISHETSNVGPALAEFDNALYLAWTGTDGRLNVMPEPIA
jgi:hypothetical protein